jgi:ABC-type phosphate/phosphonate transport system substrate-binding protein
MAPAGTRYITALPMYDWPERRGGVDAEWAAIRNRMRARGIDSPEHLTRCNSDMPPVANGIRDEQGILIAPDPATLPAGEFDLPTLWRHPALLFGQTCWGPMEFELARHVAVIGQPDYGGIEGCAGPLYSSAIVMRRSDASAGAEQKAPANGCALIPLECLRGGRFAFNSLESMSGYLALKRDLEHAHADLSLFAGLVETGSHRASVRAVANGTADVAAIDARSWELACRYEPPAQQLVVVGSTSHRQGLPFICARRLAHLSSGWQQSY